MDERRKSKRRFEDKVAIRCFVNRQSQKGLLQRIAWERAKGELNAMIAICRTAPITEACLQIESRVADAITVINQMMEDNQCKPHT